MTARQEYAKDLTLVAQDSASRLIHEVFYSHRISPNSNDFFFGEGSKSLLKRASTLPPVPGAGRQTGSRHNSPGPFSLFRQLYVKSMNMYADEAYSADGGRVSPLNESAPLHGQPNKSLPSEPLSREQKIFEVQRRFDEKMGKPAAEERQALVAKQMEECKAKQDLIDKGLARDLQHHSLATWLFVSFATVVVFAWTVTCVLCYRPIGASSYYDQAGYTTKAQWERSDAWRTAASVATAIIGSVGIPVTSAICAKAAAVHCQRKSDDEKPSLTLRQTLALADKGWTDLAVMRNVLTPKTSRRTRSPLLMVSACLVGLGKQNSTRAKSQDAAKIAA